MNNTADFNELKSILSETLQYFELSDSLIDQLLSDNFINGLLELQQQEPVNNSFISMLRNFSDEQNLCTAKEFEEELHSELCKDGYVKSVVQYINNSWLDIPFPGEIQTRSNNSIVENAKRGISIVGAMLSTLAKRFNIACTNFAGNLNQYISIAQRLDKRINDDYAIARQFDENLRAVALGIRYNTKTGENTRSPLVVDLDGDGVETIGTNSNVYFDHDNNGFAESTGWVGKDDGLLVRDLNNNGQIDDGTELFGNNSVLSSGEKAANGFEALKDLDSNNDGIFNSSDTAWNQVKVWKDANSNGVVDEGELLTLEQAGIENIDLNYQNSNAVDTNGNTVGQIGSFDKENGTQGNISDIWFNTDLMDTVDKTNIDIPADIAALPNVTGFGNVHDLHTAMALDTSGELKALVQQYAAETDSEARQQILYNIIYHWTGVQDEPIDGRDPTQVYGKVIDDTRKLEALEEFMGEEYLGTWCWGERDPNPHGKAAPYILRAFDILAEYVNNELLAQTHYKPLLENVKLIWDNTTETWSIDVSGAVAQIQSLYNENAENGITTLREFEKLVKNCGYDNLQAIYEAFRTYGSLTGSDLDAMFAKFGYTYGTDLNDDLTGTAGVDEINGLAGNDSIYGGAGNDTLDGGTGNDNIFGENGDDILIGGEGNDYLIGGNGADTYIFNPGFGNDAIDNSDDSASASEPDIIQFGEGILASKTTLGRQGYDLIITVSYDPDENGTTRPNDSIRVYSYFDQQGTSSATVNSIVFADGTTWDYEYVRDHWNSIPDANGGETLEGNNENNTINGTNYNDILIGNGGNDTINAGNGNDRLLGGTGNDTLNGGSGDDTYLWNWGDGMDTISDTGNHDKISFGDGITYSDLKFRQEGGNLRITVKNNENQGMLINGFFSSLDYKIEDLYFQDGSIVHLSEIPLTLHQLNTDETINLTGNGDTVYANGGDDRVNGGQGNDTIFGGDGNDNIYGNSGNDVISGGKGDDTIDGGNGADTYIWNLGDGLDTIAQVSSEDIIKFGPGITFDNLSFRNDNGDLRIYVNGDDTQGVICKNFFGNDSYKSKQIIFNDGTSFALPTSPLTLTQKNTSETVTATIYNDTIYANGGADTVHSGQGDDVIYGGAGFDSLYGEDGNDTLIGGTGSDYLEGGAGDDTYIYNLGDGFDTIYDYNGGNTDNDTIKFGEGISFEDLSFERDGNSLIIYVNNDKTQGIKIQDYYSSYSQVEKLKFADESVVETSTIAVTTDRSDALAAQDITGTDNNDTLTGGNFGDTLTGNDGNDVINGGAGNDTLKGNSGNDTLIGGKGNDRLEGSYGDDTYIWNLGDGFDTIYDYNGGNTDNDTIKFGEGISFEDLLFERDGNNLVIYVNNDKTQGITIQNYYSSYSQVEKLEFADGTIVETSSVSIVEPEEPSENAGQTISGTSDDDILIGSDGDDTINAEDGYNDITGGKGNDIISAGYDRDTFYYNLGDGYDKITDLGGRDQIIFGDGISKENISFYRKNDNLIISINDDFSQGIEIIDFFRNNDNRIENIKFADNSTLRLTTGLILKTNELDGSITGTVEDDTLIGNIGENNLNGSSGDDILNGGKGNDTLDGDVGNDTYIWNLGDDIDTIRDTAGLNTIKFGENISFDDLTFKQDGNNLRLIVKNDISQGIIIQDYFSSNNINNNYHPITIFEFSDGSKFDFRENNITLTYDNRAETITGNIGDNIIDAQGGDDTITTYGGDDIINGGAGDDEISSGNGNDIITGGSGNDIINGEAGNDTYIWNLGDGMDTITDSSGFDKIKFGEGITSANLSFFKQGNNLLIFINDNHQEGIIINRYFEGSYNIELLEFTDGSSINLSQSLDIKLGDTGESIDGTIYNDTITGGDGNDTINGGNGDDTLSGGIGEDTMSGGDGADIISGGTGDDTIDGGAGNDTYIWNLGDGMDTITDSQGTDKIVFGEGISYDDLSFSQTNSDLYINVQNMPNQGLLIKNYFASGNSNRIETLEFSNGNLFDLSKNALILKGDGTVNGTIYDDSITGNNNDDTITAGDGNDIIYGNAGNDNIDGGNGDDMIYGGQGCDTLKGGYGNDTYVWNLGDDLDTIEDDAGQNTLLFGNGISFNDLDFNMLGNNLLITVNGDKNQGVQINNFLNENDLYKIEYLKFSDGTSIYLPDLGLNMAYGATDDTINGTYNDDTIIAGNGNDTVNAGDGNDSIYGGKGNDALNGGNGRDSYYYNLGDGYDTITETRGNDKIIFGEGISINNLSFRQDGSNLDILINNDVSQGVTVKDFYSGTNYQVETLQFADGSTFNLSTQGLTLQQTNADDTVNGTSYNDVIYGNGGHDTINAGDGNDTIVGGIGNDILNGGNGDDTYIYNLGDGFDTITDTGGDDKIVFGEGISQSDLSFEQIGNDLKISVNGKDDKGIQINNYFQNDASKIETIEFYDGSTLNISNADQLIQAMNSFSISNSASTDALSNPTENVSDMYSLAASQDLTRKAI